MKNLKVNLIALLAIVSLAACEGGGGKGTPAAPAPAVEPEVQKPDVVTPDVETVDDPVHLKESAEKTLIDSAITTARQNKKKLMIVMHSAESMESAYLQERMNSNQSDFRKELERNFEIIDFEQMHIHSPSKILDFLPGGTSVYYPAIYLFDPTTTKWALLPIDPQSNDNMKSGIKMFMSSSSTYNAYSSQLEKMIKDRNVKFFTDNNESQRNLVSLAQVLAAASMELSKKDFFDLDNSVKRYLGPSRIDKNILSLMSLRNWQTMIGRGEILFNDVLKELDSDERLLVTTTAIGFHAPMAKAVRFGNTASSITECRTLKTSWQTDLKKNAKIQSQSVLNKQQGELKDVERKIKDTSDVFEKWELKKKAAARKMAVESLTASLAGAELDMELSCLLLSLRQGRAKPEEVTAALDLATKNPAALNVLRPIVSIIQAFNGNYDAATKTRQEDVTAKMQGIDSLNKKLNENITSLESELAKIKNQDSMKDKFDYYSKEVDGIKEIVRLNGVVKGRIQTAFDQLKAAWSSKSVIVKRN